MWIKFEKFLGKYSLRKGCIMAAILGIVQAILFTSFIWLFALLLGPKHVFLLTVVVLLTCYNIYAVVISVIVAVRKHTTSTIKKFENVYEIITILVFVLFFMLLEAFAIPTNREQEFNIIPLIGLSLMLLAVTSFNMYFFIIILSYYEELKLALSDDRSTV